MLKLPKIWRPARETKGEPANPAVPGLSAGGVKGSDAGAGGGKVIGSTAIDSKAVDGTAVDGTAVDGTAVDGTAVDGTAVDRKAAGSKDTGSADPGNAPSPAPPAIAVCNVSFTYPGADRPSLNGASLTLRAGGFYAIMGGNGCGKSTLCKLFNGLIPQYYSGEFSGTVELFGRLTEGLPVARLSRRVGYVYQDFDNQLVRPTVLDEARFAPLNYGLSQYREMADRALALCGLERLADRYIWELSGGQRHLLALAGALSLAPDILVVDEPVSQLDPAHARQVYEVLKSLHREHGKTIIVIEHHAEFIAEYCEEACLMEDGAVTWTLPAAEALARLDDLRRLGVQAPQATQAAALLAGRLVDAAHPAARAFADAPLPVTAAEAAARFAALLPAAPGPAAAGSGRPEGAAEKPAAPGPASGGGAERRAAARLRGVSLSYRTVREGPRTVLRGLNLTLYEGERIALVGNNGAGKSSLLKLLAGVASADEGTAEVLGKDTAGLTLEQLARSVAYVFQNPEDMFIDDSVQREIGYALNSRGYADAAETCGRMLRGFRLEPLQGRDARLLSGGQQRRVSLAIGAAIAPQLMLLDEPTANLDYATREELIAMLRELEQHVRTVVIATHDMELASRWATRVIVLEQGRVTGDERAETLFSDPERMHRAGVAFTQTMDISARLNLLPLCVTPEALAGRLYDAIMQGGSSHAAADPQLG